MTVALPPRNGALRGPVAALVATHVLAAPLAVRATGIPEAEDFAELGIEQLMHVSVTSVAGVEQQLLDTPSALTVVTREDIRRGGHLEIPEILRMVPGVFVGRSESHSWSIGTRGFNGGFGTKQLVQIDGRATYDLLFSGTFWDVQDVLLEDIDRIEIVRGPGATLWGANAVNGVVNVTTRRAQDTQGWYASAGGGTYERAFGELRYGGPLGEDGAFRVWGKYTDHDALETTAGADNGDAWSMSRAGFRADVPVAGARSLRVQAGAYDSGEFPVDQAASGHHVIASLASGDAVAGGATLQAYFDRTERDIAAFFVDRDTWDVDYRRFSPAGRTHALVWGVGLRNTEDDTVSTSPTNTIVLDPVGRTARTLSGFVQDTVTLRPSRVFLMLGAKVEYNEFTGFEAQPGVRLWWTPDDRRTLWAAASRPVRTPSRLEEDLSFVVPGVITLTGNRDLGAETLSALELGYRALLSDALTLDVATFYNDYDSLVATVTTPTLVTIDNGASARTSGLEVAVDWRASSRWRLRAGYAYFHADSDDDPIDAPDVTSPRHLAHLLSFADLSQAWRLDAALYYADEVEIVDVDAYVRADVGITWRNGPIELAIRGQNLLEDDHREASSTAEVPRGVYAQLSWRP
jgi:iron complex outermembrane recepter protein